MQQCRRSRRMKKTGSNMKGGWRRPRQLVSN
jgi:hypothetical protein